MTKKARIEQIVDSVASAMKAFVAAAELRIMATVSKQFEAMPKPIDGKDGHSLTADDALVAARLAVGELNLRSGDDGKDGEPGKKGDPGERGKDAEAVDVKALAADVITSVSEHAEKRLAEMVAALPKAKDGEQGAKGDKGDAAQAVPVEAIVEHAMPALVERLQAAVKELPEPEQGPRGERGEPGKDADAKAVAELVLPKLVEVARSAVAEIPQPKNGEPGKDADVDAVAEKLLPVIEKRLADAVAALPAPKNGVDGQSIEPEKILAMVKQAVSEIREPQDGRDGSPGRDAAHIDILPALDEKRIYPRATFAQHKGGLWRSHKTTEGMIGWECIVNGVDTLEIRQSEDDPRQFVAITGLSDGRTKETPLYIPAVVDKGLYKEGVDYKKGDGVTWARHYWIARTDTKAKPDYGDDWRLAVKSGRDGKDFEPQRKSGVTL